MTYSLICLLTDPKYSPELNAYYGNFKTTARGRECVYWIGHDINVAHREWLIYLPADNTQYRYLLEEGSLL